MDLFKNTVCLYSPIKQFVIAIIIYLVVFVIVIIVNKCVTNKNCRYGKKLIDFNNKCIIYNKSTLSEKLTSTRGDNYYWSDNIKNIDMKKLEKKRKYCVFSLWGLTHFVLYFILGLLSPYYFWLFFSVSIAFEIYEYYKWKCHDMLDIFINMGGLFLGIYINNYMCK